MKPINFTTFVGITAALSFFACKPRVASNALEAASAASAGKGGALMLIGGGSSSDYWDLLLPKFKALQGGDANYRLGIVSAAARSLAEDKAHPDEHGGTNNSVDNAAWWQDNWVDFGFKDRDRVIPIPVDLERCGKLAGVTPKVNTCESKEVADQARRMTAFWFSGGDQVRLVDTLFRNRTSVPPDPTLTFSAIQEAFRNGAVVSGSSSGTSAQAADLLIVSGRSYESILLPVIVSKGEKTDFAYGQMVADSRGGLGFFKYGLIDTHVNERGRIGRLIRLAAETNHSLVYAISEGTTLFVTHADTPEVDMEVFGYFGVTVIEIDLDAYQRQKAARAAQGKTDFEIHDVKLTFLTHGDHFNPNTREVTPPQWKRAIGPGDLLHNPDLLSSQDIFSTNDLSESKSKGRKAPGELDRLARTLVQDTATEVTATAFERALRIDLDEPFERELLKAVGVVDPRPNVAGENSIDIPATVKVKLHKTPATLAYTGMSPAKEEKSKNNPEGNEVRKTTYKNLLIDIWIERP